MCTITIKSAYLRELRWQSTRLQRCVLMSASMGLRIRIPCGDGRNDAWQLLIHKIALASMVLRIQTPCGDGRNDAGHCCELLRDVR